MDLDPETRSEISIKLFRNVKNSKQLKEKLLNGELQCCIIKPSLILDPFQIVVAANKAVVSEKLTTKTVYTEILFNLSMTKNITKSLQTFGIDEKDDSFLVVTLNKEGDSEDLELYKLIEGTAVSLDNLKECTDLNLIKKTYKINDKESSVSSTLDSIVSRIATKDFLSF